MQVRAGCSHASEVCSLRSRRGHPDLAPPLGAALQGSSAHAGGCLHHWLVHPGLSTSHGCRLLAPGRQRRWLVPATAAGTPSSTHGDKCASSMQAQRLEPKPPRLSLLLLALALATVGAAGQQLCTERELP